jgi:hypothetical protein
VTESNVGRRAEFDKKARAKKMPKGENVLVKGGLKPIGGQHAESPQERKERLRRVARGERP